MSRALRPMVLALALLAPMGAAGQQGGDEVRLLRDATVRESAGDLRGAETLLRQVLEERPASVPALLSLERVLRIQGRLDGLPTLVRTALEAEPRSALLNQLLVRTYAALDREADLERAANQWIRTAPEIEIPYREVAQVWAARGEYGRAREVLEQGRKRIGRDDALALELGDLYAEIGEAARAVREWERAVGVDARGLTQVRRRIRSLPDGGAAVLPRLVELLSSEPSTAERLHAAVDLAVDAGLEQRAERTAKQVLPQLDSAEVDAFLIDVARRADGARLNRLAFWAYSTLADRVPEGGRLLAIENRRAELALALGDTASAAASYESVEAAYELGTPQRRQAAALRIELMAGQAVDSAVAALRSFRAEYPDAPEADQLAASVARSLAGAGRAVEAEALLTGVRGPQSGLLRARMALARGDVEAARLAYMSAAPGLHGGEATQVLSLVTLLSRVSEPAGAVLGEAMGLQEDEPGAAVDRIDESLPSLRLEDRPPLLEFAAAIADGAGLADDARRLRRRIISEYPRANEAPAALLALARSLRGEAGGQVEARELLERLIIEYPRSALAPQARRELEQLSRTGMAGPEAQGRQHE